MRQRPLLVISFVSTEKYRSHRWATYASKMEELLEVQFSARSVQRVQNEVVAVGNWLVNQSRIGTGAVREAKVSRLSAVGSRYQKTGED
jgi:hypothetical protein